MELLHDRRPAAAEAQARILTYLVQNTIAASDERIVVLGFVSTKTPELEVWGSA